MLSSCTGIATSSTRCRGRKLAAPHEGEHNVSSLLELLGKGLGTELMEFVIPHCRPLDVHDAEMLEQAILDDSNHLPNRLRLGIHYAQSAAGDAAEHIFLDILQKFPDHLDTHLAWAAMCLSNGEVDKAIEMLQKARDYHEHDSRIYYGMGHSYERVGDPVKACQYYSEAAQRSPYLVQARQRLAAISLFQQQYDQATEYCQKLIKDHPEDAWNYLMAGMIDLFQGKYSEAIDSFERALTIEPDNFEMYDDRVEALAKDGDFQAAINMILDNMEANETFPDTFVRLADLYSQLGDDNNAVLNYSRALEMYPGYLEAAVKLGTQHLRNGRYYEAAAQFNAAAEINDQLITTYVALAAAQMKSGDSSSARDTVELAVALEPNSTLLFAEMARLQLKSSRSNTVNHDFLDFDDPAPLETSPDDMLALQMRRHYDALQKTPGQANLHYRYATLLNGAGNLEDAITHYQHAIEINPSYAKARLKLALGLYQSGKQVEAFDHFYQLFDLKQEFVDLHYKLGLMFCDKIQFALAVEHFEATAKDNDDRDNVQANLSLALQNMGLVNRSAAQWRAVCELEPDNMLSLKSERSFMKLVPME